MVQHFTTSGRRRKVTQRPLQFGAGDDVPGAKHAKGDKILEADVQKAVLALLKQHPRVAWAHRFNSRVLDVPDRNSKSGFRPMRMAFKGCSDILGQLKPLPGERAGAALAVECKSTNGDLTDDQSAFLSLVSRSGGCAFVARRADDVMRYIEAFDRGD